ncbi:hypothetical protein [Haloarcula argentinensis]|uniref:Uncharacterized protein n=1 Tax=Haloarcula argentinensis TaxID=43776 RepID=A0A847UPH2_HALAR|nr:hypothetical protein [Haloarcula argentinensis]NLV14427.1 hypothetical protein [Haloarcula argentinensis]
MGTIRISGENTGISDNYDYEIGIDGTAENATDGISDYFEDGKIIGSIGPGEDKFEFEGTITSADIPWFARIYVNGQRRSEAGMIGMDGTHWSEEQQNQPAEPTAPTETEQTETETTEPTVPTEQSDQTEQTDNGTETMTTGGSDPDPLAWVVALAAVGAAVYYSQS